MHGEEPVELHLGSLPPFESEPVPGSELRLDGPDAVGPLRMEAGVVLERGGVAEVER
jgi:hypothetical protein